jgi:hypothetical protein
VAHNVVVVVVVVVKRSAGRRRNNVNFDFEWKLLLFVSRNETACRALQAMTTRTKT